MNSDYVFLCGVMWCGYGQQEAGRELLRAALSPIRISARLLGLCLRKERLRSGRNR